jgi:hypothetical protein
MDNIILSIIDNVGYAMRKDGLAAQAEVALHHVGYGLQIVKLI